jgi:uncharacterized protein YdcH (DUF465 family)
MNKERCPNMERQESEDLKSHLMQTSEEFRELARRHQALDEKVAQLENDPLATAEDEIEEHRLKKIKLHLKDRMEEFVSRYKTQHV